MCGIAGIVRWQGSSDADAAQLAQMLRILEHRGPDGGGTHRGRHAVLGHRRLAIIDPDGSRQPLCNEDESIWLTFNGEVYNYRELRADLVARGHRFRTLGDAEVVVHLYEERGADALEALRGMFAFALWDAPRRLLLLARDRLGVKPLYVHEDRDRVVFASRLDAVVAAGTPREIDPCAIADFLAFGFIASPRTALRHVAKLEPAQRWICRPAGTQRETYWSLRHAGWQRGDEQDLSAELEAQLRDATRHRLVSDVPLGILLSGGVDSAAVLAAAADERSQPPATFTVGFDEAEFDERSAALETARRAGAEHRSAIVRPQPAALLDELRDVFDEPFADPSAIPMLFLARFARRYVKVALSGDGGDEALAGYRRYRFDLWENRVRRCLPHRFRATWLPRLARRTPTSPDLPRWLRGAATLENLAVDPADAHARSIARMRPDAWSNLLAPDLADSLARYDPWQRPRELYERCDAPDPLAKSQYVDLRFELPDGILTKVDRASMACGLEVRSPMLDYRFIEFCSRIPPTMRLRRGAGKYLLRRFVERRLGPSVGTRPKRGFDVALDRALRMEIRPHVDALRNDASANVWSYVDRAAFDRLWQDHVAATRNHGPIIWSVVMLQNWFDHRPAAGSYSPTTPALTNTCIPHWSDA